ncbi:hypothetical protein RCL1_004142 [Eukaryota sp. TZLM3-RCL]
MVTIIETLTFTVGTIFVGILLILAIASLTHPHTAILGLYGAVFASLLALIWFSILFLVGLDWVFAWVAIVLGIVIGYFLAFYVQMTQLPQMVALLNGLGGAAAVLLGISTFFEPGLFNVITILVAVFLAIWIGAATFWGSMIAVAKLSDRPKILARDYGGPIRTLLFLLTLAGIIALLVLLLLQDVGSAIGWWFILGILVLSSILGALFVMGIGGADMPVAISVLNSLSGAATAAAGFLIRSDFVVVLGALVFASGAILAWLMAKAMNRNLAAVIWGKWSGSKTEKGAKAERERVTSWTPDEVAKELAKAKRVMIIPGYGLAVSRAQFATVDLANRLRDMGIKVTFVLHPVAGRMPGHMSVEEANSRMESVDVALVIGANDTVNPSAIEDPNSPIAGMPIVEVHRAKMVVMLKRSLSFGYAAIDNPLWYRENCNMLYSDAKQGVEDIIAALPKSQNNRQVADEVEEDDELETPCVEEEEDPFGGVPFERRVRVFVPKEKEPETRVALTPAIVKKLSRLGFYVFVQSGAGDLSRFNDEQYELAGAVIVNDYNEGVDCLRESYVTDSPVLEEQIVLSTTEFVNNENEMENYDQDYYIAEEDT